jgi:hypothetical protein
MHMHLLIKSPDHDLQDPYPINDVFNAVIFLLPPMAPAVPAPISTSVIMLLANLLPKTVPAPAQQMAQSSVTKCEYTCPHAPPSQTDCCMFCGSTEHFIGHCQERNKYIQASKCKLDEANKLILPDGSCITGHK